MGRRPSAADPVPFDDFEPLRVEGTGEFRLPALQPSEQEGAQPWEPVYRALRGREGTKDRFAACLMRLTALMRVVASGRLASHAREAPGEPGHYLVSEPLLRAAAAFPMARLGHFDEAAFEREVVEDL